MANDDKVIKALEKLENKVDIIDNRLDSVDKTLVKQEANLGEHMRRTELAEKNISNVRKDIEPVKRHVAYMEGALKGIGIVGILMGIIAGAVKIFTSL